MIWYILFLVAVFSGLVLLICKWIKEAPIGWEDKDGFHYDFRDRQGFYRDGCEYGSEQEADDSIKNGINWQKEPETK